MKIISHKPDNTAYLRTIRNCEKWITLNGYDFYMVQNSDGTREYYIHIKGTEDLVDPIAWDTYKTPEQVKAEILQSADRLPLFGTVAGKLDRIRAAIDAGNWTSNADAFFCELMGENALADEARLNRAKIYEKRERESQERRAKEEAERRAREEDEQRKRLTAMEQATQKLRNGKFITAEEFELLAEKYAVKLPIKFVGWLREHGGDICIRPFTEDERGRYEGKYSVQYYHDRGHKSTTIFNYADQIATAAGL